MFVKNFVSRTRTAPNDKIFYRKKPDRLQKLIMRKVIVSSGIEKPRSIRTDNVANHIIFVVHPTEENQTVTLKALCVKYSVILIDWGDGKIESIVTGCGGYKGNTSHTYKNPNDNYIVRIYPHENASTINCEKPYIYIDASTQIIYIESFGQEVFDFHTISISDLPLLESFNPYMFYQLTRLECITISNTNISCLPYYLFYSCENLKTADLSYNDRLITINEDLFKNCPLLEQVSFSYCLSLVEIPAGLFKNKIALTSLKKCFSGCKINNLPNNLLEDCMNLKDISYLFANTSELLEIPEDLFSNQINVTDVSCVFSNSAIEHVPCNLFNQLRCVKTLSGCFEYCYNLKVVPEKLFDQCYKATDFSKAFFCCNSLAEIPAGLFKNCRLVTSYDNAFTNTKITYVPDIFRASKPCSFYETFSYCNELEEISMTIFEECTDKTMLSCTFYSCDKLSYVKDDCTAGNIDDISYCFADCRSLIKVPADIFINNPILDASSVFRNCTMLSYAPPMWEYLDNLKLKHESAFSGTSENISNYLDIPTEWK